MINIRKFTAGLIVPIAALTLACGNNDQAKVDDALNNDLSLAAQANDRRLDSISAVERGYVAPAPAPVRTSTAPRTRTVYRSSTTSSGTRTTATASAPAPQRTRVVKNTKRDAAIGATAGAVIGATTSKDKVKGAVIGAAAGGILGAIIGNNVDKKTVPED